MGRGVLRSNCFKTHIGFDPQWRWYNGVVVLSFISEDHLESWKMHLDSIAPKGRPQNETNILMETCMSPAFSTRMSYL